MPVPLFDLDGYSTGSVAAIAHTLHDFYYMLKQDCEKARQDD